MMTVEQVVAANKANVETLFGLTNKAFEGVERLVELNLQVAKAAMSREMLAAGLTGCMTSRISTRSHSSCGTSRSRASESIPCRRPSRATGKLVWRCSARVCSMNSLTRQSGETLTAGAVMIAPTVPSTRQRDSMRCRCSSAA